MSKLSTLIVDASMKSVFQQCFVENQTSKALAMFLKTVEGGENLMSYWHVMSFSGLADGWGKVQWMQQYQ
jgi:hypothetical protein